MLHILFLILKIIGIILLVIIGIAIALVGIVLFVPVRYRIKAETTESLKGLRLEAKATWLLHLISAFVVYKEKKLDWQVRIAWKKFRVSDVESKQEKSSDVNKKSETMLEQQDTLQKQGSEETPREKSEPQDVPEAKPKVKKSVKANKKKVNWFEKIKCTIKSICDKIKKVKDYITDETHLKALLRLKNELVFFLKKIKPDKMKGFVRFGLEDPYNTGIVLAVLSVLYPFYGENFEIYPEFEKEILEGDVFIKGRIHFIHLLLIICKIYFDDNVKVAYKNLKTLKE